MKKTVAPAHDLSEKALKALARADKHARVAKEVMLTEITQIRSKDKLDTIPDLVASSQEDASSQNVSSALVPLLQPEADEANSPEGITSPKKARSPSASPKARCPDASLKVRSPPQARSPQIYAGPTTTGCARCQKGAR